MVLLLYVAVWCSRASLARKESVLLIDNDLSHFQQVIVGLFGETQGCVITSALHTMRVFQTLKPRLFKTSDRRDWYNLPFNEIPRTIGLVLKICDDVARITALRLVNIEFCV
jgi:hypothetical protein